VDPTDNDLGAASCGGVLRVDRVPPSCRRRSVNDAHFAVTIDSRRRLFLPLSLLFRSMFAFEAVHRSCTSIRRVYVRDVGAAPVASPRSEPYAPNPGLLEPGTLAVYFTPVQVGTRCNHGSSLVGSALLNKSLPL
jgi:hypothetical protein